MSQLIVRGSNNLWCFIFFAFPYLHFHVWGAGTEGWTVWLNTKAEDWIESSDKSSTHCVRSRGSTNENIVIEVNRCIGSCCFHLTAQASLPENYPVEALKVVLLKNGQDYGFSLSKDEFVWPLCRISEEALSSPEVVTCKRIWSSSKCFEHDSFCCTETCGRKWSQDHFWRL